MARNSNRPRGARSSAPARRRHNTSWIRAPLRALAAELVLRILIYARYSKEEQNPRSIEAQVEFCRAFLEDLGVPNYELTVLSDDGISGEIISRPGIDQVRAGIAARQWDLIVAEDSSRLFRNGPACLILVGSAVDQQMRVICFNDSIDTEEERWDETLEEAQRHHTRSNRFTSLRIKRAAEDRWQQGAAMGPLRSGYVRGPSYEATAHEPARGPFWDAIDERWAPVVRETFERVAAGEPIWSVGRWLDEVGLPKTNGQLSGNWTEIRVRSLIQCTLYRGLDRFGHTRSQKVYGTGKHKPRRAEPGEFWEREMGHLRIVSDSLWFAANGAIERRNHHKRRLRGAANPLSGVDRYRRGAISGLFVCGICGRKMYRQGRNERGSQCPAARTDCWMKATSLLDKTHEKLSQAICEQLNRLDEAACEAMLERAESILGADSQSRQEQILSKRAQAEQLETTCQRLAAAIEQLDDPQQSLSRLVERLSQQETELACVRAELQQLLDTHGSAQLPTVQQLLDRRDQAVQRLQVFDAEAGVELARLASVIRAVPYQQFGGNLVVLRAAFALNPAGLLPEGVRLELTATSGQALEELFDSVPMMVDLFDASTGPAYGLRAVELADQGLQLTAIGLELGFDARLAKGRGYLALKYGRQMRAAGITDPYIELTEPPASASRWRRHPRLGEADERGEADQAA